MAYDDYQLIRVAVAGGICRATIVDAGAQTRDFERGAIRPRSGPRT